jgi:hypothetical protein
MHFRKAPQPQEKKEIPTKLLTFLCEFPPLFPLNETQITNAWVAYLENQTQKTSLRDFVGFLYNYNHNTNLTYHDAYAAFQKEKEEKLEKLAITALNMGGFNYGRNSMESDQK